MKKFFTIVTLLALIAVVSCNEKESPVTKDMPGTVTFEMKVKIPETVVVTRGDCANDPIIDHIYVATFGSRHYLNEYVKAIPVSSYAETNEPDTYTMKVTLLATSSERHVHVIANGPESLDYQTQDTDLMLQMSTGYNDEDKPQGAYWQYFHLPNGTAVLGDDGNWTASSSATQALENVLLVRNFARITVTNLASNFVLEGFHVFRTESEGSIAMPTSKNGGQDFLSTVTYTSVTPGVSPVAHIRSIHYDGYTPEGVALHEETASTGATWLTPDSYQYVYESVKDRSTDNQPFIILVGHRSNESVSKYYRMELTDADGNEYPIFRNLDYSINIHTVADDIIGYDDPSEIEKPCNGNISVLVLSELEKLSDGLSSLAVLYTDKTYVNNSTTDSKSESFMYLYTPSVSEGSSVTIETVGFEGEGHAIDGAGDVDAQGAFKNDWYTVTDAANNWKKVTFNVLPSTTYSGEAVTTFKVTGRSEGQSLFRMIKVHLLPVQDFIDAKVVTAGVGKDDGVTITFTLPDDLPVSVFPLEVSVADTQNSLNPTGTDMPLVLDGDGVYHFTKTISPEEYETSKVVTCNMRFIEAITSTVISIDSEFFNKQTATVNRAGTFNFSK